ncbi:MAG: hypothetical protein GTN71_07505 [Anaerolineae bacterium]|nr:hypothetical protein [Anaerolineae bacterium]
MSQPTFDLSDLFGAALQAMLPEVGIIALTVLDIESYRQAALAAGVNDFVSKTSLSTDLLPAIRRVAQADPSWPRTADGPAH